MTKFLVFLIGTVVIFTCTFLIVFFITSFITWKIDFTFLKYITYKDLRIFILLIILLTVWFTFVEYFKKPF